MAIAAIRPARRPATRYLSPLILTHSLAAFYKGKVGMSQQMMRLRVVAQGATVAALILGTSVAGLDFEVRSVHQPWLRRCSPLFFFLARAAESSPQAARREELIVNKALSFLVCTSHHIHP